MAQYREKYIRKLSTNNHDFKILIGYIEIENNIWDGFRVDGVGQFSLPTGLALPSRCVQSCARIIATSAISPIASARSVGREN